MSRIRINAQGIPKIASLSTIPAPNPQLEARVCNGRLVDDGENDDCGNPAGNIASSSPSSSTQVILVSVTSTSVQIVVTTSTLTTSTVVEATSIPLISTSSSNSISTSATTSNTALAESTAASPVPGSITAGTSTSTISGVKLSPGIIIGIVLGVAAFIAAANLSIWFLARRQRKSREAAAKLAYYNEDRGQAAMGEMVPEPLFSTAGVLVQK